MIMDTFLSWLLKVWMTLTGNKPKELPQSLYEGVESEPAKIKADDDIVMLGALVKVKRELNGDVLPDELTQATITRMLTITIPELFRKNFINGPDELYISYTDVKLTSDRLSFGTEDSFAKALPHVIKKLQSLGVTSRISSGMLIISRADLMTVATKHDIDPVEEEADFTVNSTGIYR